MTNCPHTDVEYRVLYIAGKVVHRCKSCGLEVHHPIPDKYRAKIIRHPSELENPNA